MALIILEGLDRTGKSTIASRFEDEGYEVIHFSAPDKKYSQPGYTGPSYLDDIIDLIQQASNRDIIFDRSHYGEPLWSQIYNRESLLSEEDMEILREIEDAVGVRRILMHDPNTEAHWQRCVANKEPLTRPQFMRARTMYERLATKYGFEKLSLAEEMPEHVSPVNQQNSAPDNPKAVPEKTNQGQKVTKEQMKLEKANAINEVLSRRIVKGKTPIYDDIEKEVRTFLNSMLGTILGSEDKNSLTQEETFILKAFVKRLKEKDAK